MRSFRTLLRLAGTCLLCWASLAYATAPLPREVLPLRASLDVNRRAALAQADAAIAVARSQHNAPALLAGLTGQALVASLSEGPQPLRTTLEEAAPLADSLKDAPTRALLRGLAAEQLSGEGKFDAALDSFRESETLAQNAHAADTLAYVQLRHARLLIHDLIRPLAALPLLDASLHRFDQAHDTARAAEAYALYAAAFAQLQQPERTANARQKARESLDATQRPALTADLLLSLALEPGPAAQTLPDLQQALALYQQIDDKLGLARTEQVLARAALARQDWPQALALLEHAELAFNAAGRPVDAACAQADLAVTLAGMYDERAQRELDAAGKILLNVKQAAFERHYHEAAARTAESFGKFETAYHELEAALGAARTLFAADQGPGQGDEGLHYESERREAENMRLRLTQALQESELKARDAQRIALSIGLAMAILVLGLGAFALRRQIRLKHRYARLAMRDELTGAPNRRAILRYAGRELRRSDAHAHPMLLAIIDLDHFKTINDTCGHDVGDVALKFFYRALTRHLRVPDQLGRLGGEEWLLVMPSAQAEIVGTVFARLQSAARALQVPGIPPERQLTFSMGATVLGDNDNLDAMLKRADEALYRAKTEGRDRIVFSPPPRSDDGETVMNMA